MTYTSRKNNNTTTSKTIKTFKDYLVPIIFVTIVLLVIINSLFSNETKPTKIPTANIEVSLSIPNSEAYLITEGDKKNKIENKLLMKSNEKLQVVNGGLSIKTGSGEISLNKLGELKYNDDGSYILYNSDLWVKSNSKINIEMKYAKVSSQNEAVFSLSQNEVASTLYVLSGMVNIEGLTGKSTTLSKGERIVVMRINSNDETFDLSLAKEEIDENTKGDDWFIKNNGGAFLTKIENSQTGGINQIGNSGTLNSTGSNIINTNLYVNFLNLYDEMEVDTSSINVDGTLNSDIVAKIEINNILAKIDTQTRSFSIKGISLDSRINDLVYKIYDDGNKLLSKGIFTIYTTDFSGVNNSDKNNDKIKNPIASVENYPITSSLAYKILTPKKNPYITSDDRIKLEGSVPAGTVESIMINDFELKKFPKYGSYWSYFANSDFGNLKEGENIYKIKYFGEGGKLLYENIFKILKTPKEDDIIKKEELKIKEKEVKVIEKETKITDDKLETTDSKNTNNKVGNTNTVDLNLETTQSGTIGE